MVASDGIGLDKLKSVADVWASIDVGNGGGEVEFLVGIFGHDFLSIVSHPPSYQNLH